MFTVIRAVLLKPLRYSNPNTLVEVVGGATVLRLEHLQHNSADIIQVAGYTPQETLTLSGGVEPQVVNGARISAGFLDILGVQPKMGRSFLPAEDSPSGAPVVMISAELWTRMFGLDQDLTNKIIVLNTAPYTVIGVLPQGFAFPYSGIDVWLTRPVEWPLMPAKSREMSPFLNVFGRLRQNVNMSTANSEMAVVHGRYASANPTMLDAHPKSRNELRPLKDQLVSSVRSMLWMLFGAVSFVLLITCANVATLMLSRATARSREFAIRAALGASRLRLIRQLLAESITLALAGGAIGVFLAWQAVRTIPLITSFVLPRSNEIHIDWGVLTFALALSIVTGVLFGLAPILGASRPDLIQVLRGTGVAARKAAPARSMLVVAQVALSIILLIGATLLIQSLLRLRGANIGFNPSNLLTLKVSLPSARYDSGVKETTFFQDLVAKIATTPGVRHATVAMYLPMTGGFAGTPVQDANTPPLKLNQRPIATILVVLPDFFETLQIPMRRGRDFSARDNADGERVAIIDEQFARRFWPRYPAGPDPLGQRILIGGSNPNPARIIGIVGSVHQNIENSGWPETVYVSFAQAPQPFAMMAVRTDGDPVRLVSSVRQVVHGIDRDQAISDVSSMDDCLDVQIGQRRLVVGLLGTFASVALLLAVIGLYGVVSYSVAQRVQELGIRSALGARKSDIVQLVIRQGLTLTVAGIAIGMLAAVWLTHLLKAYLIDLTSVSAVAFVAVGAVFVLIAFVASYIPAQRAARVDPMTALRV